MMLLLSILNLLVLLALLLLERKKNPTNLFSAVSIFIYFALLPVFSNLYFSFNIEKFKDIVFNLIASKYHDMNYVYLAILFNIISNIIAYLGINKGLKSKNIIFHRYLNKIFLNGIQIENNINLNKIYKFGLITYFLGIVVYMYFLTKIGGLNNLWLALYLRSSINAGLGYFQTFYMYAIQIGAMLILYYFMLRKNKLIVFVIIVSTILILGSMGARGPIIIFLISLLLMYHFLIKKINHIFSLKIISLIIIIPILIVVVLQFRFYSFDYLINNPKLLLAKSIESLEEGFLARIGRLERDIVILKYFNENQFWFGRSYLGLIYAPIPRTIFPDKPPNDTGMYLRVIALGYRVEPPEPIYKLEKSSWPEQNWVGYMNFGLIGFLIFFYMAGLLYGKFYKYLIKTNFGVFQTITFSYLAVGGIPILSPPGLIKIIMFLLIIYILIHFIYKPFIK